MLSEAFLVRENPYFETRAAAENRHIGVYVTVGKSEER